MYCYIVCGHGELLNFTQEIKGPAIGDYIINLVKTFDRNRDQFILTLYVEYEM